MHVEEMDRKACFDLLHRRDLARLGCCIEGRPYVVPINYVLDACHLYSFATFGRKIETMRTNPNVCIEVDEITHNMAWSTVIASGRYEEREADDARDHAWTLLSKRSNWWQPGYVRTLVSGDERPLVPIFFRILIEEVSGHRIKRPSRVPLRQQSRLKRILDDLLGVRDSAL